MSESRRFGPKTADHLKNAPPRHRECPACHKEFKVGDYTTLVAIGPGDSEEGQELCRNGRPYNAVAIEAHYMCVTGKTE